jgi:hypothetical protein
MSKGKIKETRGESTPSEAQARDVLFRCRVNGLRTQNADNELAGAEMGCWEHLRGLLAAEILVP